MRLLGKIFLTCVNAIGPKHSVLEEIFQIGLAQLLLPNEHISDESAIVYKC